MRSLSAFVLVVSCGVALSAQAEPEGAPARAEADECFQRGKALVKQGKLEEARQAYLEGWALRKGYDIAGNLGNVELELGLPRDAAEHLAFCIRSFPATGTGKQLAQIKARFAEAKGRVGALAIQVNVDGAEVLIDGASIGRSPLADDVFVEPGERAIAARLAGREPSLQRVDVAQGSWHSVALTLAPEEKPVAAGPRPPPSPPLVPVARAKSKALILTGVGAALAGIGAGIAGVALAGQRAASADRQRAALESVGGTSACLGAAHRAECARLDQAYVARASLGAAGAVGFTAGGVLAIATALYALVPAGRSSPSTPRLDAAVTPGAVEAGVTWTF